MALYEVTRTDEVQPGEFVSAYVVTGGTGMARRLVAHLPGVTAKNVLATKVDVGKVNALIGIYFDERLDN